MNGDIVKDISPENKVKKDEPILYPVLSIVGFDEKQANEMKTLAEINNRYIALSGQYEQIKKNLMGIREVIREVTEDKVHVEDIRVPYGSGLTRMLRNDEKDYFIKIYNEALKSEEIKFNALISQMQHTADTLGEQRMRCFRILYSCLHNQHSYKSEDIVKILVGEQEYTHDYLGSDKVFDRIQNVIEKVKTDA